MIDADLTNRAVVAYFKLEGLSDVLEITRQAELSRYNTTVFITPLRVSTSRRCQYIMEHILCVGRPRIRSLAILNNLPTVSYFYMHSREILPQSANGSTLQLSKDD